MCLNLQKVLGVHAFTNVFTEVHVPKYYYSPHPLKSVIVTFAPTLMKILNETLTVLISRC